MFHAAEWQGLTFVRDKTAFAQSNGKLACCRERFCVEPILWTDGLSSGEESDFFCCKADEPLLRFKDIHVSRPDVSDPKAYLVPAKFLA